MGDLGTETFSLETVLREWGPLAEKSREILHACVITPVEAECEKSRQSGEVALCQFAEKHWEWAQLIGGVQKKPGKKCKTVVTNLKTGEQLCVDGASKENLDNLVRSLTFAETIGQAFGVEHLECGMHPQKKTVWKK